ncbi:MAG: hypothetical protein FJW30_21705 [Acidobacteria bacterium]|nr:hypothetical protein [Acidobacteriota bacterium]
MADLTIVEKKKLEQFFGMGSGYVLDFSNRSFEEFVRDSVGLDIFDSRYDYGSGAKANRLRAFWMKESNAVVGKLLSDLLDWAEPKGVQHEVCCLIVNRLLGNSTSGSVAQSDGLAAATAASQHRSRELEKLRDEFLALASDADRARAGLALERVLNRLFHLYELQPREPFRVVGEQIDGSFELDSHIYLIESKWEKKPMPEADLLVFRGKIEGKSTFTRGVFIALNGISKEAQDAITRGKAPSFIVMDGWDLTMILNEKMTLPDFLRKRIRLLAEQGRVCVNFAELS